MYSISIEGKLKALKEIKKVISEYYRDNEVEQIEGVVYQGLGSPQFIYDLLIGAESKLAIQGNIELLAKKLGVKEIRIKRLMKEYTTTELNTAYMRGGKIVVRKKLSVSKNY